MNTLFEHTSSLWARYSSYEWKEATDGNLYLTPAKEATFGVYNPLRDAQQLVVDALNIGRMCMGKKPDPEIQKAIKGFAVKYGLFGLMTALPTTTEFMDYEAVYLPKNPFIKAETMDTMEYLDLFFPFEKLDVVKRGSDFIWNIEGDSSMMAFVATMSIRPTTVNMSFQREYAERYDWLKQQFTDWIFIFSTSFFYYLDYDKYNEDTRNLLRKSMSAYDHNAPSYHIALLDKPTIIWDFHSLLLGIQMMFSFMLTEQKTPLRLCRNCQKVFIASRPSNQFCSPECKNRYNVYKNRKRKKEAYGES